MSTFRRRAISFVAFASLSDSAELLLGAALFPLAASTSAAAALGGTGGGGLEVDATATALGAMLSKLEDDDELLLTRRRFASAFPKVSTSGAAGATAEEGDGAEEDDFESFMAARTAVAEGFGRCSVTSREPPCSCGCSALRLLPFIGWRAAATGGGEGDEPRPELLDDDEPDEDDEEDTPPSGDSGRSFLLALATGTGGAAATSFLGRRTSPELPPAEPLFEAELVEAGTPEPDPDVGLIKIMSCVVVTIFPGGEGAGLFVFEFVVEPFLATSSISPVAPPDEISRNSNTGAGRTNVAAMSWKAVAGGPRASAPRPAGDSTSISNS